MEEDFSDIFYNKKSSYRVEIRKKKNI